MKNIVEIFIIPLCLGAFIACTTNNVRFVNDSGNKKVDVYFGDNYFTSYIYPEEMEKQVLYPITTFSGKEVTRGYPLNPKPFERTDHPHHVGLWFSYGDVNGLDFWNNSFAIKPEDKHKYGTIKFKEIVNVNPGTGTLITASDWINSKNDLLLNEVSTYVFNEKDKVRSITCVFELTAQTEVAFTENKEGMIGLRMDRAFEEPADSPGEFLDSEGNITDIHVLDNEGVNGVYRNAEGDRGGEVWGKRSPWVALRGEKDGEVITVAILDYHENPNYPAWSHARGYGLFASNNLAGRAVDENSAPVKIILEPEESITFKYKVIIGGELTDKQITLIADDFNNVSTPKTPIIQIYPPHKV